VQVVIGARLDLHVGSPRQFKNGMGLLAHCHSLRCGGCRLIGEPA
jgi:hypothetical protein